MYTYINVGDYGPVDFSTNTISIVFSQIKSKQILLTTMIINMYKLYFGLFDRI